MESLSCYDEKGISKLIKYKNLEISIIIIFILS